MTFQFTKLAIAAVGNSNNLSTNAIDDTKSAVAHFKLSKANEASDYIDAIDTILKEVNSKRSTLGAIPNRLESSSTYSLP